MGFRIRDFRVQILGDHIVYSPNQDTSESERVQYE